MSFALRASPRRDFARGVERQRGEPDGGKARANVVAAQVGQPDAMAARVGEGRVGGAGTAELGVDVDHVADIDDEQEGRPAFVGRQRPRVAFGLGAGNHHGVVETACGADAQFLGFEYEGAAPVAVGEVGRGAAVAGNEGDAALEDVGVVGGVGARRVGLGQTEQFAQFADEELVVGALGAVGRLPAGDEGVDGDGRGRDGGHDGGV